MGKFKSLCTENSGDFKESLETAREEVFNLVLETIRELSSILEINGVSVSSLNNGNFISRLVDATNLKQLSILIELLEILSNEITKIA